MGLSEMQQKYCRAKDYYELDSGKACASLGFWLNKKEASPIGTTFMNNVG